jgi:hypothetical protein
MKAECGLHLGNVSDRGGEDFGRLDAACTEASSDEFNGNLK